MRTIFLPDVHLGGVELHMLYERKIWMRFDCCSQACLKDRQPKCVLAVEDIKALVMDSLTHC